MPLYNGIEVNVESREDDEDSGSEYIAAEAVSRVSRARMYLRITPGFCGSYLLTSLPILSDVKTCKAMILAASEYAVDNSVGVLYFHHPYQRESGRAINDYDNFVEAATELGAVLLHSMHNRNSSNHCKMYALPVGDSNFKLNS